MPATDQVDAGFAVCLAELMAAVALLVSEGIADAHLFLVRDTLLDRGRTRLVQEALTWEATHMLWLDSDMQFPPLAAHQLLARNKDIVGANYAARRPPHLPAAIAALSNVTLGTPTVRCYTREDSSGLEAVEALGFGCLLMKMRVFDKVKMPAFATHFDLTERKWIGEDVDFALKARAQGLEIFVDHDLSHEVRHAGRWEYTSEQAVLAGQQQIIVTPTDAERDRVAGLVR